MSLSTILSAYLLGGITFIPLLLAAILLPAWFALPQVQAAEDLKARKDDPDENAAVKAAETAQDDNFSPDGAASASFAVLRSYNFPSAVAALNSKSSAATGAAGEGGSDAAGQESVSVYQSMYRSVFDRNKTTLQSKNALVEQEDTPVGAGARIKPSNPGKHVFFVVLRHGHLMLYNSPAQLEVRHVISLAHHSVSLSDGDNDDENITEADLFVKRTAILLEPVLSSADTPSVQSQPRPFYLFSNTCSEKEDFYHALLAAQSEPPVPQPLDPACAIKLQSTLHSTSLTPETRALNALISRVFLALHRTDYVERFVRSKIERKISRVQKPAFIASLAVQSIDLGDAAPILSNPRLKDLHISGDMVVAMDVKYNGGIKMVISAVAKLDLGPRFKVRTVDLVLAGSLQRLQGRILVRIKPPPSNRLWFTFDGMPDMDIKVEPIVSSRQITYTFILRAIENRIREVVGETLVKPNWDDVPFFNTLRQTFRGGLWQHQPGTDDEEIDPSAADGSRPVSAEDSLAFKNEKTMSMPILPRTGEDANDQGISSDSQLADDLALPPDAADSKHGLKRRSVMSLPPQLAQKEKAAERFTAPPPKSMRSPSLASPAPAAPSTAVDGANVDAVKGNDGPRPNKRWIGRTTLPAGRRDIADVVREVRDRAMAKDEGDLAASPVIDPSATIAHNSTEDLHADIDSDVGDLRDRKGSDASNELFRNASTSTLPQPEASIHTTPSRTSTARTDTNASSASSNDPHRLRGKNLLAATAAATTAARQWTWNAVAARKQGSPGAHVEGKPAVQEPMGRGQPLPPPGVPLPGPPAQRSLWSGSGFGSVKRKPVLPVRNKDAVSTGNLSKTEGSDDAGVAMNNSTQDVDENDFGPWTQNYNKHDTAETDVSLAGGTRETDSESRPSTQNGQTEAPNEPRSAPPLPPRRKQVPGSPTRSSTNTSSSENVKPAPADTHQQSDSNQSAAGSSAKVKPKLPARPSRRSTASTRSDRRSSLATDDASIGEEVPAIPAPIDAAEEGGEELALHEAGNLHVTEAESSGHAQVSLESDADMGSSARGGSLHHVPGHTADSQGHAVKAATRDDSTSG